MKEPLLVFATHNFGKLEEMQRLLAPFGLTCVGAARLGLVEPEENGDTFAANAAIKAEAAFAAIGRPVLADDSGLVVPALSGQPGVHTARFAGPRRDFAFAIEKLRSMLGEDESTRAVAELVSSVCFIDAEGRNTTAEARLLGRLSFPARGEGPGFEPVFVPEGERRALAEMPDAERLSRHPRAQAVASIAEALKRSLLG